MLVPKPILNPLFAKYFLFFEDTDLALKNWIADPETDLLSFFQSDRPLTAEVFGLVALQLLGFVPNVDFTDSVAFLEKMAFPIALMVALITFTSC